MKDFRAFTDDEPDEKSTRVLVDSIEIAESGALVLIRVQGSHFLWKMVRRMVGVLAAVGRGDLKPSDAARLLQDDEGPVTPAALSAPAAGLFLEAVLYKGDAGQGLSGPFSMWTTSLIRILPLYPGFSDCLLYSRVYRIIRTFVGALGTTSDGFHPSCTTSKSSAVRLLKAGFSTPLSHRASIVPLMYMSVPLSATISP